MDKELIIKEIKSQLTGNRLQDYHFLKAKLDELAKNPETVEAAREKAERAYNALKVNVLPR